MDIAKNTVSAKGQVEEYDIVRPVQRGGKINVLFLGNSITRHAPAEDIGWMDDWGMAASKEENDYVHVAVRMLDKIYGKVNYCTACCGDWERAYFKDENIPRWKMARDFNADIIVVRLGENIWGPLRENLAAVPLYPHMAVVIGLCAFLLWFAIVASSGKLFRRFNVKREKLATLLSALVITAPFMYVYIAATKTPRALKDMY